METLRQGRRQNKKKKKLMEISIQDLEPDGNNEFFFIIHYYNEWKMTLVFTPLSLEWKFPFIFFILTASLSECGPVPSLPPVLSVVQGSHSHPAVTTAHDMEAAK